MKNGIYLLLLPKTSSHTDLDFLIEDYFPRKLKNKIAYQFVNQSNGYFNKYPSDLKKKVKDELAKIDYKTEENYIGFKVLLDKIQEIIDGTSIQNLVEVP